MAQTKKTAPAARPAKAAKAPSKKAAGAPKPAKKPASTADRKPKAAEKPKAKAEKAPAKKVVPAARASAKAIPAARASAKELAKPSSKDLAKAAKEAPKGSSKDVAKASSRDVSKSSRDVSKSSTDVSKPSSRDVAKSSRDVSKSSTDVSKSSRDVSKSSRDVSKSSRDVSKSSRDVTKEAAKSSRDLAKAAQPAPVKIEPKYIEPDLGTYRTRPPPPMPRIASQPPPPPAPPPPRPPMPPAKGYQPIVTIQPFPRSTEPLNLTVGDKAVHPLHGLGEVSSIEHREVGGVSGDFYILRILDKGMRVMVPKNSATSSGLRAVMSEKDANAVLDTLRAKEVAVDLQPWSRRFRAYTEMMKSGSPHEVAKVLRDMFRLKFDKDLSFGERRLLDQAKSLLMKELAAAKKVSEADLLAEVSDMFRA